MENRWSAAARALLLLTGTIGAGCAAQVGGATTDESTAERASADEALAEVPDIGAATEALTGQDCVSCNLDGYYCDGTTLTFQIKQCNWFGCWCAKTMGKPCPNAKCVVESCGKNDHCG